jgi:hypothetical protein
MAPDLRCPAQPRNDGFSRSRSEAAILLPFSLAENGSSVSRHGYPEPDRQLTTKPGHRREHALPVCVTKRAILPVLCRTPGTFRDPAFSLTHLINRQICGPCWLPRLTWRADAECVI